jgi:hypothetical protein
MAQKKKGGLLQPTPRNESPGSPEDPNISGGGLYGSWDEVMSVHLSMDDAHLVGSPNVNVGSGIMGGPAAGEPNPAGMSPTSETFDNKD